jgi:hypothetical protein
LNIFSLGRLASIDKQEGMVKKENRKIDPLSTRPHETLI